ncbi:uncharacterized protein LOC117105411 [Anneissia japonica]|uniref:uncharacterized protein LOC117105411 n=1 Tax=Anneissia japonica TaxID=1529436 RepID=UPI001425A6D8|nr:uncharacterized protein LOC117105411 [Anneissia japonica]
MLKRYSSWSRASRVLALCIVFSYKCRGWKRSGDLTTQDIDRAKKLMVKATQHNHYKELDKLTQLDPVVDQDGLIRVGGRLKRSISLPESIKCPVVIPSKSELTRLIVTHYHQVTHHQGRGITLNAIRAGGFHIIGGVSSVARFIHNCVLCRRLRRKPETQRMADLPPDRLEPAPAFTHCGVDLFGPFEVKNDRKLEKRYGVLFTCLVSRSVHIEVASSLSTDSFLNAFRRLVARRGAVKQLRSDQGTNFIGVSRELREAMTEMNQEDLKSQLLHLNCNWLFNVPTASHHGGVWERMIKTVRSILDALMLQHRAQLNDEMLITFMAEAEGIVNSRPLCTTEDASLEPLTPAHLLMMKPFVPPPPGNFNTNGRYSRKM